MLSLIISINQDIQYTWGKKLASLAGKRKTNNKKLKGNVEMDWRKGGETYDLYKSTNLIFPPQTPNPYATISRHYTSHKTPIETQNVFTNVFVGVCVWVGVTGGENSLTWK